MEEVELEQNQILSEEEKRKLLLQLLLAQSGQADAAQSAQENNGSWEMMLKSLLNQLPPVIAVKGLGDTAREIFSGGGKSPAATNPVTQSATAPPQPPALVPSHDQPQYYSGDLQGAVGVFDIPGARLETQPAFRERTIIPGTEEFVQKGILAAFPGRLTQEEALMRLGRIRQQAQEWMQQKSAEQAQRQAAVQTLLESQNLTGLEPADPERDQRIAWARGVIENDPKAQEDLAIALDASRRGDIQEMARRFIEDQLSTQSQPLYQNLPPEVRDAIRTQSEEARRGATTFVHGKEVPRPEVLEARRGVSEFAQRLLAAEAARDRGGAGGSGALGAAVALSGLATQPGQIGGVGGAGASAPPGGQQGEENRLVSVMVNDPYKFLTYTDNLSMMHLNRAQKYAEIARGPVSRASSMIWQLIQQDPQLSQMIKPPQSDEEAKKLAEQLANWNFREAIRVQKRRQQFADAYANDDVTTAVKLGLDIFSFRNPFDTEDEFGVKKNFLALVH